MLEVGFEPTKRDASDLKSLPFDQTRERYLELFIAKIDYIQKIKFCLNF